MEFCSDMEVKLIDHMGTDMSIVRAAKVSTLSDDVDPRSPEKMIDFLMGNRHLSPFAHPMLTFRIDAPIFVWREIMRHRSFQYNEQSGRYTEMRPEFYVPSLGRKLVQVGKTGNYEFEDGTQQQYEVMLDGIVRCSHESWKQYQKMLDKGIAKEVARMVLPVNIYSAAYMTGPLRSWLQFLSLRTKDETSTYPSYPQREIEMVAERIEAECDRLFPYTMTAWNKHGRVGL